MKIFTINLLGGIVFLFLGVDIFITGQFYTRGYTFTGPHAYIIGSIFIILGSIFMKIWISNNRK